ncbi:hypothetical protein FJD34_06310 [Pseudomonas brenneri]|uniref:Uncharacterized protein n=1 Tax=Pseudomonas brenneri TaxID=129817 RepID=A0A5B2UT43_9PSED|nr:hypothetical protein [Pseudomonas brenneri]KAA2230293.1 hypothetical protein F1720_13335 [Pseudomonas brenneri]TWR81542.1 hypothetical protein FJD34_06310 [Pseudomonas brenneri]
MSGHVKNKMWERACSR